MNISESQHSKYISRNHDQDKSKKSFSWKNNLGKPREYFIYEIRVLEIYRKERKGRV